MKINSNQSTKAYVTLFAGLSFMCFSAVLIKSSHAKGIITAFYRMGIGSMILIIPFIWHILKNKPQLPRKGILLAILGGLCFGGDMSFWATGVVASNATIPTIFANIAPLWVGIGSMLLFKEKHAKGFWIGLVLALIGIPITVYKDMFMRNGMIKGALFGLIAGLFYGAFYLFTQPGRRLLDTLSYLFISSFTSTFVILIVALVLGYNFTGYDQHTWLIFLALGLGVQVIGWLLINYAQGYLPASIVSPTLLGQPVLTAILATLLINENLTHIQIAGGSIVIAGIYIVHYSRKK